MNILTVHTWYSLCDRMCITTPLIGYQAGVACKDCQMFLYFSTDSLTCHTHNRASIIRTLQSLVASSAISTKLSLCRWSAIFKVRPFNRMRSELTRSQCNRQDTSTNLLSLIYYVLALSPPLASSTATKSICVAVSLM